MRYTQIDLGLKGPAPTLRMMHVKDANPVIYSQRLSRNECLNYRRISSGYKYIYIFI